ncbi:MAG: hypothetical protein HXX09_02490 [Bacteroidetes bacterium]|nr:hypothetical protein [Bacteroidota bacterium]
MKNKRNIKWLKKPQPSNYSDAFSYLGLIYDGNKIVEFMKLFKSASISEFKARDIIRAANITDITNTNLQIEEDRKKIKKEVALSPVLLVRDPVNTRVIIAEGYYRVAAAYSIDENAVIPCKII